MKTALLLLVTLAVAAGPAQALRCHVCSSSTNCRKPQTCPTSSRYCRTMTKVEPLAGNLVEKDCSESCTPAYSMQGQVSSGTAATLCCQGDLCNESLQSHAPARILLSSATLSLALALGLLAFILVPNL
ncbi:lymphocyte antigen 6D [Diceros bicornis minor]|uniref:Lymphocyte antigen 6D n=1 Tax=Ceratotherium simum simum TaxID=73337 RepID=A0ABM0HP50_CERSS|nr:PREDICTED: lymphocyte antigen 6D [Ceratotherium simum simum]XP_058420444.1 lymphocyte antigen 6D [Diceros bicornis minor]